MTKINDEFDFSEANGGRCVEYVSVFTGERFDCIDVVDDGSAARGFKPKYWCFMGSHIPVELVKCSFITNNHNVTVPYEIAKERGFK